jgi:hypothetical protein
MKEGIKGKRWPGCKIESGGTPWNRFGIERSPVPFGRIDPDANRRRLLQSI